MLATSAHSRHVWAEPVMGTVVSFDVRGSQHERARTAVASAVQSLHRVDETFSTYREDSAIRRLDRGELLRSDAPPEVRWVLMRCAALARLTAGYFDARATGQLDPSALVKGWALDRAGAILRDSGVEHFCITGGGDVICHGQAQPGEPWRVGIQHPLARDAIAAVVCGSGLAIATSGTYERGNHIRNPYSTEPPQGVLSVTVTGPDLGTADAFSTAAFAMGHFGPDWTAKLPGRGYQAMTILADHTVHATPDFPLSSAAA